MDWQRLPVVSHSNSAPPFQIVSSGPVPWIPGSAFGGPSMTAVQSSNARQLAVFANPCHPSSMATRNINLTDALDRFVAEKVSSGSYQNASEVVRAGLRLLQVEEEARAERIKRLKAEIQPAIDDIEAGRYEVIEPGKMGVFWARIEQEAQAEVKRRQTVRKKK